MFLKSWILDESLSKTMKWQFGIECGSNIYKKAWIRNSVIFNWMNLTFELRFYFSIKETSTFELQFCFKLQQSIPPIHIPTPTLAPAHPLGDTSGRCVSTLWGGIEIESKWFRKVEVNSRRIRSEITMEPKRSPREAAVKSKWSWLRLL